MSPLIRIFFGALTLKEGSSEVTDVATQVSPFYDAGPILHPCSVIAPGAPILFGSHSNP